MALIDEIENFLCEQEMAPSRFGRLVSDTNLIRTMKQGRELSTPMEERIRGFMRNYRAGLIANIVPPSKPRSAPAPTVEPVLPPHQQNQRDSAQGMGEFNAFRQMMIRGDKSFLPAVRRERDAFVRRLRAQISTLERTYHDTCNR